MTRALRLLAAAAVMAFVVAACGSDQGSPAATSGGGTSAAATSAPGGGKAGGTGGKASGTASGNASAATGKITIKDFRYGDPLTVKPGAQIEVVNVDTAGHDVVSDDGKFRTPVLGKDEKATFTAPMEPGTYKFSCSVHPGSMSGIGTLIVRG